MDYLVIESRGENKIIEEKDALYFMEASEFLFDLLEADNPYVIALSKRFKKIHNPESKFWTEDRIKKANFLT